MEKLFDGEEYGAFGDERMRPVQPLIELGKSDGANEVTFRIPEAWHSRIQAICEKCKCQEDFLLRKAIQAFFGFSPIIFDDNEYLVQMREVFDLEDERALRPHIQDEDDDLTKRVIWERNQHIKGKRNKK